MRKKIGTIVSAGIGILMLGVILYTLLGKQIDRPIKKDNVIVKTFSGDHEDSPDMEEDEFPVSEILGILPYEGNIESMGNTIQLDVYDLQFRVNNARYTKEAVDSDAIFSAKEDGEHPPYDFDENGNILNDFNYVVVNVTVINPRDQETQIYMNDFHFVSINESTGDGEMPFYCGDMRGYKTYAAGPSLDKSYAAVKIPAKGELTCDLVYIQTDSDIEGKISYLKTKGLGGSIDEYAKSSRFVRLW